MRPRYLCQDKGSGDQGADVVANRGSQRIVIQCKKYNRPVGNKAVREVFAAKAHYRANMAAVVSNAGYTKSAMAIAASTGVQLLHFTDLRRLGGEPQNDVASFLSQARSTVWKRESGGRE